MDTNQKVEEIDRIADEAFDIARALHRLRNHITQNEVPEPALDVALAMAKLVDDRNKALMTLLRMLESPRSTLPSMFNTGLPRAMGWLKTGL